tara:strand:+ start:575 stop:874 length:300 start_codon:yes stop_codon:yes gene_type:complete
MDIYLHTTLSVGVVLVTYAIGTWFSMQRHISLGVEHALNKLEREDCIRIKHNADGEKEIISHSESYKDLHLEINMLKRNVYELESQLNICRKKTVDKLV